jgi:amidohydrolase
MNTLIVQLTTLRKYIHQHPEISGLEENTAIFLLNEFKNLNPSLIIEFIGGHGFLVVFDSGKEGDSLLFRSELDGLPIYETSDFEHKSIYNGKGHQCGHDGHMAMLLGLGYFLSENPIKSGKVSLLYQPAEETGAGADLVIHDPKFSTLHFDEVFALHNLPGFELGSIVVKENAFTAAVKSVVFQLHGKTAHAAEPENGINPSLAVADILRKLESLNHNNPKQDDFKLVTIVHVKIGEQAYGVSAGEAEIHLTYRSWSNEQLELLENDILKIVTAISIQYYLVTEHHFLQTFYANENSKESVDIVRFAANHLAFKTVENEVPFKWGEDFGYFTKKYKGCLFGLGSGLNQPSLHHPNYDFPDELIPYGVEIFKEIINLRLK